MSDLQYDDTTVKKISLSDANSQDVYARVTVDVKVLSKADPITVTGGKKNRI